MNHITYNVPVALVETYRGQNLVARSHDSTELQDAYCKWPCKAYSCGGVNKLFRTMQNAAGELRRDLGTYLRAKSEQAP
jgi:hypothetical protein